MIDLPLVETMTLFHVAPGGQSSASCYDAGMLSAGLTGNIACGKSFVASVLAELGAQVLDADCVAHDLLRPGETTRDRVVEAFGQGIARADGTVDRRLLGSIVFADRAKRNLLNSIVHPEVRRRVGSWLAESARSLPSGVAVVQAALMVESGSYRLYDRILVVTCPPDLQLARLMSRDGSSAEQARSRIEAQMPQAEKVRYADYCIDTGGGFDSARQQAADVYVRLLAEAQSKG
jgi:dephospho-CoA kinase